jgi:hypothetical protein
MEGQGDEEEHSKMSILIVSIGDVDLKIIQTLKYDLKRVFNKPVEIGKGLSEPHYAYNKIRVFSKSSGSYLSFLSPSLAKRG